MGRLEDTEEVRSGSHCGSEKRESENEETEHTEHGAGMNGILQQGQRLGQCADMQAAMIKRLVPARWDGAGAGLRVITITGWGKEEKKTTINHNRNN